ncbi:MAG TPA: HemK2/MTQ2 family protein methyltransferase [Thermoanaerobaculia bacterium]|nr:HemK2/MTQ2 family protein methyltransferase [Thermoanaerobaculia bacterium]
MNALFRSIHRASLPILRSVLMRRVRRLVLERWDGLPILVLPDVLNPVVFRSGILLADTLAALPHPDAKEPRALDMGTGSGIGALALARAGYSVVAVDVNPEAVRCARINALLNQLEERIDVREGNLFEPVSGERFDVVAFNPPFFEGTPSDLHDAAWRSTGVFERFAAQLPGHLAPGGLVLVLLSNHGEEEKQCAALRAAGLEVSVHARRDYISEVLTVWAARHPGTS